MPKKDTASAIVGMLSTAGAQTRQPPPAGGTDQNNQPPAVAPDELHGDTQASVRTLPTPTRAAASAGLEAPRTLRLRPDTAQRLRAAWLEAKRDDVLLTAQDFASNLVDEALRRHRRSAQTS